VYLDHITASWGSANYHSKRVAVVYLCVY